MKRSWNVVLVCTLWLHISRLTAAINHHDDNNFASVTNDLKIISPHFSQPHYFIPSLVQQRTSNSTNPTLDLISSSSSLQHRLSHESSPSTQSTVSLRSSASSSPSFPLTSSSTFIAPYIGYNYYPSAYGWGEMWKQFTQALPAMRYELSTFPSANLIRIFIDFQLFGGGVVCPKDNFHHLEQFLTLAASNSLSVVVTLFDGDIDTALTNFTLTDFYLDCLLSLYAHDSRIVLWDLINEPDGRGFVDPNMSPDPANDPTKGWNPTALRWLIHVYDYVRSLSSYAPATQPCSIGTVLNSGWLIDLCVMKDNSTGRPIFGKTAAEFVPQYHEYSPFSGKVADEAAFTDKLKSDFDGVYTQCGQRPVFIGEFGTPSNYSTSLSPDTFDDHYHHRSREDTPLRGDDDGDGNDMAIWSMEYPPFPDTEPYTELYQAHKYYLFLNFTSELNNGAHTNENTKKKQVNDLSSSKLWGVSVWTLNDFVHASGTGEMYFGMVRSLTDYSYKPSASILQQFIKPSP